MFTKNILILCASCFILSFALTISAGETTTKNLKRKIASYSSPDIKNGKIVLDNFIKCKEKLPTKNETKYVFLNCTNKYLSQTMTESEKNRYSAWLLMGIDLTNIRSCENDENINYIMDDSFDLIICFNLKIEGKSKNGYVLYLRENDQLKIKALKY